MRGAYFGEGTGPVLLTYVRCSWIKSSLFYCDDDYTRRITYRNHNNDVGVRCQGMATTLRLIINVHVVPPQPCESGDIRIYSSNPLSGTVQVCISGTWGDICNNYWGSNDARVACRQLGFPAEGQKCLLWL